MILKKTIRFASFAMVFLGLGGVSASCSDDEEDLCYKCTYGGDSETLCYDDYKDDYTKAEFKEIIATFEDYFGDICKKK